jgi:hypothetical protein
MSYFDRHPNQFRLLFGLLACHLLVLVGVTFYQLAIRPTDENLFTNPQSNLYITKDFPATLLVGKNGQADNEARLGDLIVGVEKNPVIDRDDLRKELARTPHALAEITIFRFGTNEKRMYRVAKSYLTNEFIRDLGPTARVINVTAGGASDRAGMETGDLILRINGQTFKNSLDADRILAEGQVGKALLYDVLRNNKVLSLHVTIAAIGVPFPILVSTLCGLFFFGVGLFLGFGRSRFIAARLISLTFLAYGYFIMVFLVRRGFGMSAFETVRDLTMLFAIFLAVPLLIHAGHYFPKERPELIARPWVRRVGYGLAILGLLGALVFKNPAFLGGLAILVVYTITVTLLYRKEASEEYKRLNGVVKVASIIAGVGALACAFYFVYQLQTQQGVFFGYITVPLLLIPLAHLYTIGRYRLMGLDLRIRRNVQYILVTTVWIAALSVVAFRVLFWLQGADLPIPNIHLSATSIEVLDAPLQPEQRIWWEKGILMLFSVLVVYGTWKIAQRGQTLIDSSSGRDTTIAMQQTSWLKSWQRR